VHCIGNAARRPSSLNATRVIQSVMDRLHAEEFMARLLHAHGAEDAFEPVLQDPDPEEPAETGRTPAA
jgi:hypothetical protein